MSNFSFTQLVNIDQIRLLLEAQYKISGILSAILDTDENILVAVGWQDICTRFHRVHPAACARCRESDAYIKAHLQDFRDGYLDYRCRNGLRDVAMPIIIGGEHLATLFTGQFFYEDEKPDEGFFRAQAEEFGFDTDEYLDALNRVPLSSRDQIRSIMDYYRSLVNVMAEMGMKNLLLTREVAERVKAESEARNSGEYLDKIINSIPDPIFVKDREHRLVLVNDAECALAGRSREDILGRTDYEFFPKDQVDVFWEKDEIVFETEQENINEEEITDAQGRKRVILTKKSLYKDQSEEKYIVGIIRDITELKQKEQELKTLNQELESRVAKRTSELAALNHDLMTEIEERRQAEQRLSLMNAALDHVREAAFLIDEQACFRYVNEEACRTLGYTRDELLTLKVADIDPNYQLENWPGHWREIKTKGSLTFESRHRGRDGRGFPVEITVSLIEFEGCEYVLAMARDISERKEYERRLELLNFALDHMHEGAYLCDENSAFSFVNKEACQALGYSREELLDMKVFDIDPDFPPERWPALWRQLKTDRSILLETRHKARDGHIFPVEISANYIEFEGRGYGMALARDITERKIAENEIRKRQRQLEDLNDTLEKKVEEEVAKNRAKDILIIQQNRQAAMGEMLDHIAHQWKQPLNSISIIVQDLLDAASCNELTEKYIAKSVGETLALVNHMSQTISVFRDFYRPEKEKTVFCVKDSVDMARDFMDAALRRHSIEVELDVEPDLAATGYPKEYAQVLLNLLGNAENVLVERKIKNPLIRIKAFREGGKTVVTITDNAGGIPDNLIDKIFEAYFTTRESSGGSGIGLYISRNIIEKNMGGTLSATNVASGAQLKIEIPLG